MGRYSDAVNEGYKKLPHSDALARGIKDSLHWFYGGLTEEQRIAEWDDWDKRQKRFHRPEQICDYVQFCIQPSRFIHSQWIHRGMPLL
jgi:hypothetical protein